MSTTVASRRRILIGSQGVRKLLGAGKVITELRFPRARRSFPAAGPDLSNSTIRQRIENAVLDLAG